MKLLNLACGGCRPGEPWTNLDCLHSQFAVGTPERAQIDKEPNYVDHFLGPNRMPFEDDSFSGVLASHCLEHWDCMEAVRILEDCRRVLEPGGILMASVPDASYFRKVHDEDTRLAAQRLFGEPIINPDKTTFRSYALFFEQHKAVLTEDAVWALFVESGFDDQTIYRFEDGFEIKSEIKDAMASVVNRAKFSVIMVTKK